ncbi:unnamed protein product [Hanseniaspora opuntiae]
MTTQMPLKTKLAAQKMNNLVCLKSSIYKIINLNLAEEFQMPDVHQSDLSDKFHIQDEHQDAPQADLPEEFHMQDDQQFDDMSDIYDNYQGLSDDEYYEDTVDHFKNTMKAKTAYESFHVEYRETQTAMLTSFLDIYNQPDCFPSLQFVCGPPSSGADFTIKTMLKHFKKTTENFDYISIKKSSVIDFKGFLKTTARELYNLLNHKYKADLTKVLGTEIENKVSKRKRKKTKKNDDPKSEIWIGLESNGILSKL